jgi:hypothetical protein
MKVFFLNYSVTHLADEQSEILEKIKPYLLTREGVEEVFDPQKADTLLIQEKRSFKNFRYIKELLQDPLISKNVGKVFTINSDDCATGLLRGLYTSIPRTRFNPNLHAVVPYMEFPNDQVFTNQNKNNSPQFLAGWRGNPKSNVVRKKLFENFQHSPDYCLENTQSWLNHSSEEKKIYVDIILNSKFSLCPTGWAPVSFRIYESMALGRCPVIIADKFVPPAGPRWEDFALFLPERKIHQLQDFLLEYEQDWNFLGRKALEAWNKYFNSKAIAEYYAQSLTTLFETTSHTSPQKEFKRWNSLLFYWSNNWTIPQRVVNKIRRLKLSPEE